VVVGVDGSEESLHAVEWAALEARRHRAPLRIVSAPGLSPPMRAYDASPQTVANAQRCAASRALEAAIPQAEEDAPGLFIDTDCWPGRRRWRWPAAAQAHCCW
jgi:nucleotide-binding universal stress UspA family protein